MGTRVYLSCTLNEELVDLHCHIVPIQHHLCMLEADDDVWDEVRVRIFAFSSLLWLANCSMLELYEMSHPHGC
jgi:Protein similar to CwfJ C-terminus 1